jgi:hypothetical protein
LHALGDDGAVGAEDAARARTLALWARLAALHRQLADAYDDLLAGGAEDLGSVDKRLDESSDSRHITSVKCATTNAPAPPRRMLSATALATLLDEVPPPGSPRSPNAKALALALPQGVLLRGQASPKPWSLVHSPLLEPYSELRRCTVNDEATAVACVRRGKAILVNL